MGRILRWLLALTLALTGIASIPAWAEDEDVVDRLQLTYDVQTDGTVRVTYEMDWRFSGTGRHGIEFDLITAEPWDDNPRMMARYDITDIDVTSPSDAPTKVEQSTVEGPQGAEMLRLRIGDSNTTISDDVETYVISYTIDGLLRTFEHPELHADVTTTDFPAIKEFSAKVQATDAIPRARCLAGKDECKANSDGATATYIATDVPSGDQLTVVAQLPDGQQGAKPNLEARETHTSQKNSEHTTMTFDRDGVAHVEQRWKEYLGQAGVAVMTFEAPKRRNDTYAFARHYDIEDLTIVDSAGEKLKLEESKFAGRLDSVDPVEWLRTVDDVKYVVRGPSDPSLVDEDGYAEFTATWTMDGLVSKSDDVATVELPVLSQHDRHAPPSDERHEWVLPEAVTNVECAPMNGESMCEQEPLARNGATVALEWTRGKIDKGRPWATATLPASAFDDVNTNVGLSLAVMWILIVAGVLTAVKVLLAIPKRIGRALGSRAGKQPDERFAGVAPGVVAGKGARVTTDPLQGQIPVRFEPPEAPLALAGHLKHRDFSARTTAALLTKMAVDDSLTISTKPLSVAKGKPSNLASHLEGAIFHAADDHPGVKLYETKMRQINKAVKEDADAAMSKRRLFQPRADYEPTGLARFPASTLGVLCLFGLLMWGGAALVWRVLPLWIPLALAGAWILFAMIERAVDAYAASRRATPRALGADGTALAEQPEGFRQYIATAEAKQLSFEAEGDIFRRYLPWAVLFGETARWTKICQELAAAGHIEPVDTGWVHVAEETERESRHSYEEERRERERAAAASSSSGSSSRGGSGSRSGFSSSSSGGSGGGGASARSW